MTGLEAVASGALRSSKPTVAESRRYVLKVGGTDLRGYLSHIALSTADDGKRPIAKVQLTKSIPPFDYFGSFDVSYERGETKSPSFTGSITTVVVDSDGLLIDASTMAEFSDLGVAAYATVDVGAIDMIYMLARTSGFDEENIKLQIGSTPLLETIEIAVPLRGCVVDRAVNITDRVRLVSRDSVNLRQYSSLDPLSPLISDFNECEAIAITYVTDARRLYDAESRGRARIRTAMDWLTIQLRNGSSHSPDGAVRAFDRAEARTALSLQPTVLATGLLTGRSWLRNTSVPMARHVLEGPRLAAAVRVLPRSDDRSGLSYAAMGRAGDESLDGMSRVTALWDALEFYAAAVEVEKSFTKSEMRNLRKRSIDGLSDSQIGRLDQAFQQLNASSLLQRVWIQAASDGVPISSSDRDIITRMRSVRNDAIHGRNLQPPSRKELAHAVSVVARLLVHAAYSRR